MQALLSTYTDELNSNWHCFTDKKLACMYLVDGQVVEWVQTVNCYIEDIGEQLDRAEHVDNL